MKEVLDNERLQVTILALEGKASAWYNAPSGSSGGHTNTSRNLGSSVGGVSSVRSGTKGIEGGSQVRNFRNLSRMRTEKW